MIKTCLFFLALIVPSIAMSDISMSVPMLAHQLQKSTELGKLHVEGLGDVNLVARRNGNQLVIHAQDSFGHTVGKAETVVGLKETPIYVLTPQGLEKITIYWGAD
jgi:hypothetical protein